MLKVSMNIQQVDTKAGFKVWNGARYEVILGIAKASGCMDCMQGRSNLWKASL